MSGFAFAPVADAPRDSIDTAWLPAGRAVAVVHRGTPAHLPLAYSAAFAAVDRLGATAVGPVIEEYTGASIRVCIPLSNRRARSGPDARDRET